MFVREIQKLFPIILRYLVNARTNMMTSRDHLGLVQFRHFTCAKSVFAELAIGRGGGLCG